MGAPNLPNRGLVTPAGSSTPQPSGDDRGRLAYLLDAIRMRPVGKRALTALSALLFLAGAGMFAYPLATDVYADRVIQVGLEDSFSAPEFREQYVTRTLAPDDPLTRIVMPDLDVDAIVVAGTSPSALRAGAGHYPNTPLPGERGNVGIAGHRTTYGKPFNRLDELPVGSEIRLETPLAVHTYEVVQAPDDARQPCSNGACWITTPTDWSVVSDLDGHFLTLTTCHPKGSARERLIVRAELVDTTDRLDPEIDT